MSFNAGLFDPEFRGSNHCNFLYFVGIHGRRVHPKRSTRKYGQQEQKIPMAEHTLQSIAFPVLSDEQIAQVANSAAPRHCKDGERLISVGDRNFKFFIVKSGEIEIIDPSGEQPRVMTVHRKGQFTGDVSHLTGMPAMMNAVTKGDCEVFEISSEALRHVLNQCPA